MYDNNNYNNFNGTSGGEPPVNNQNENQGFNDNQNYNNNQGFNPDYSVGSNNQSYGNDPYGDSESYRERHSFFENGQQNVAPTTTKLLIHMNGELLQIMDRIILETLTTKRLRKKRSL